MGPGSKCKCTHKGRGGERKGRKKRGRKKFGWPRGGVGGSRRTPFIPFYNKRCVKKEKRKREREKKKKALIEKKFFILINL